MDSESRIHVAGHRGLVGSAVVRLLNSKGYKNLLLPTREQVDLRDQSAVNYWFKATRPEYVFLVAGTVGGILPNSTRPADFLYDNLMIHSTVVHAAYTFGVRKLLYLGSSCIYPRDCPQPMKEEYLLTGSLEPTNEAYAIAKIAGMRLCHAYRRQHGCNFISAMPTNLYGPGDNFDHENAHVLPALMRRFYEARENGSSKVVVWGSGAPRREFLHVDDLADACLFLMLNYDQGDHVNVGVGKDTSIREAAELLRKIISPGLSLEFDSSKPDGMPRKLLDTSKLEALGWKPRIGFEEGLRSTFAWFERHYEQAISERSVVQVGR